MVRLKLFFGVVAQKNCLPPKIEINLRLEKTGKKLRHEIF
jgi:hypothetical protein